MRVVVNDLAFLFPFYGETELIEAIRKWIYVCRELESGRCHEVDSLIRIRLDKSLELAPDCSIYKVIQKITDRNERSYLLSLLTNREDLPLSPKFPFVYKGRESYLCAWAREEALVSLEAEEGFKKPGLVGTIQGNAIEICNISREEHLFCHRNRLGIRIYEPNEGKHKKDRENYYGKNRVASPMDLTGREAQELLDKAIWIKNRLYARKGKNNYAFQNTRDCIYHGYIAADLGDDILNVLYQKKWD